MRIDAHIHFTPPALAAEMPRLEASEPFWGLLLAPDAAGAGPDWAAPEQMIADMDRAGIDKAVIQGNYWQQHETAVACNSAVLALLQRWPQRLLAFASIQPKAGAAALAELERCLGGGMCGVGEIGPYGQGYTLEDPDFLRLVEACIGHDVPLNLHTNEEVGHFYPGKCATPLAAYYRLAGRYPELKLILAHWGGGLLFYEMMPEVRRVLTNVSYDTAASPLLFPTATIFATALAAVDYHKILYASDYPLRICPRKQEGPDFRPFLAEMEEVALAPEVRAGIMGGNAARLLGLVPGEPAGRRVPRPPVRRRVQVITEVDPLGSAAITGNVAVRAAATAWPATTAVFDRYGIAWQEGNAPFWEPISQAAAARGLNAEVRQRLLADLNAAAGAS